MTFELLWFAIPSNIRLAILIFLFLLLFRKPLIYLIEKTVSLLIFLLKIVMIILYFLLEKILLILYKMFGSALNSINHFFDDLRYQTMMFLNKLKEIWMKAVQKRAGWTKNYKLATYILPITIAFVVHQWPEHPISKYWYASEEKVFLNTFQVEVVSADAARAELYSWIDLAVIGSEKVSGEVENSPVQLKLSSDYTGGNIRAGAANNQKIITSIGPEDVVVFLGESSTDSRGIKWYKVKTAQGKVGWISGKIVEEI